jgi:propanol-preferring alcohol dehydrogenase
MTAMQLSAPGPVETSRLAAVAQPRPALQLGLNAPNLLLRVLACGVCHTDLHLVEGDLAPRRLPVTPGHQVVAEVAAAAPGIATPRVGDRVGVPWLYSACGRCAYCRRGLENLCDQAQFTGWDVDGGYAGYMLARADFVVPLPPGLTPEQAAPLLCAGIIGYRALRLAEVQPGERVGFFGFGASAHLAIQVARHWGCLVAVFTRAAHHRRLAESLGAAWTGSADNGPDWPLDRAVIFAPAGSLVPLALARLRKGGTLAINAIHMSPLPQLDYNLLYGERTLRTVTNATRQDAIEFMQLAAAIPVAAEVEVFPLRDANAALVRLKRSELRGAAVLQPGD